MNPRLKAISWKIGHFFRRRDINWGLYRHFELLVISWDDHSVKVLIEDSATGRLIESIIDVGTEAMQLDRQEMYEMIQSMIVAQFPKPRKLKDSLTP